MKISKFEEIISSSISKLKPALSQAQLPAFEQMLNALPKKYKELNAEPYFFIFETMMRKKQLVEPALSSLAMMLQQNYITQILYDRLSASLSPLMKDHSYSAVQVIIKIKEPHIEFFRLYFQIFASVALPEDLLSKFKAQGYQWLVRAFSLTKRDLPALQTSIYAKFYPQQLLKLNSDVQEGQSLKKYVGLVLGQIVDEAQNCLQSAKRGKYGLCMICRKPAEYYCKDTRVPVCGVDCKKSHLSILTTNNCLNSQYSDLFRKEIEKLLLTYLNNRQGSSLCLDFLVAIYSFSDYQPSYPLNHHRILTLPLIFERIWMLYLSYYSKKNQLFQHIFASCLSLQNQFSKDMATSYFINLAASSRILEVYWSFDRKGRFRLIDCLLRKLHEQKRGEFLQKLLVTVFNSHHRNNVVYQYSEMGAVRSFNHEKELTASLLQGMFGQNYYQKLTELIFRNQLLINRQKLGEHLCANQDFLRVFLAQLSSRKSLAPVDELIREIFYFLNIKISDKIYRLFEVLTEVFQPQHPFTESNFFTYAYFIIMIVTQLNNPSITNKPTIQQVINRVKQFSPQLAKDHRDIIEGMFERISLSPFSQNSRGLLVYYQPVTLIPPTNILSEELIIQNHELVYQIVLGCNPDVTLLYRICTLVINHPAICQLFLQLLVDKLQEQQRDQFLTEAITNIIDKQPNAAGYLWRQILEEYKKGLAESSSTLSLSAIIQCSSALTDGNFKQFMRQLCFFCPITETIDHYIQLFSLNRQRLSLVMPAIIANYERSHDCYLKLVLIKRLAWFLQRVPDQNLEILLLKAMKDIIILPYTQGLAVETFVSIKFGKMKSSDEFWTALGTKCLEIRNERLVFVLQNYLKASSIKFYETYLIQKTLSSCKSDHISEQILRNLQKLQPYIHEIKLDLLRLFVLQENLQIILRRFSFFSRFNQTYSVILQCMKKQPQLLDCENSKLIFNEIKTILRTQNQPILLELVDLSPILVALLDIIPEYSVLQSIRDYAHIIMAEFQVKPSQNSLLSIINFNILSQSLNNYAYKISDHAENKQKVMLIIDLLWTMHSKARQFHTNIQLRLAIQKLLKIDKPKAGLPSLLSSSILILKTIFLLQNKLSHPNETSLMRIFQQVEAVIIYFSSLSQSKDYLQSQKFTLTEASKDALHYGDLAIELARYYLKEKGDLTSKDRATVRSIIIRVLIQGYFNEQSAVFQSLAGSQLASKAEEVFYLLK